MQLQVSAREGLQISRELAGGTCELPMQGETKTSPSQIGDHDFRQKNITPPPPVGYWLTPFLTWTLETGGILTTERLYLVILHSCEVKTGSGLEAAVLPVEASNPPLIPEGMRGSKGEKCRTMKCLTEIFYFKYKSGFDGEFNIEPDKARIHIKMLTSRIDLNRSE